ncbi:MAG TPA: molybdopterin-dependent oxidoreductase, partial [Xanthobacteraceae bacterium]
MSRLALAIDLERCIGCKSCEAACKAEHGLGPRVYRNRVQWLGDPHLPALDFLTITCQHCERPACLRACPVSPKAIIKEPTSGVVRMDESRCTGCGECVLACPYGAMGYDPVDHHAVKCDLCSERRALGDEPACASVCPARAIRFGEREGLLAEAQAAGRGVRDHDEFLLGPATLYLDRLARERGVDAIARGKPPAVLADARSRAPLDDVAVLPPYRMAREQRTADRVEAGGCNICFNACSLKFHFRGDRLVRVTGNDEDPVFEGRVCAKSQMTLQLYENPWRLTQPLKRVGKRGEGRFEPITWDRALDEIAARLRSVRQAHGAEALAIQAGTRTGVLTITGYIELFAQLWGTPNYEGTEPLCASGKNIAYRLTQGDMNLANVFTDDDIGAAKLYVFIGDNQAETRPVFFGMVNDWRVRHGTKLIVVDPRLTPTAAKADRWLAIRSGTDMALGLALAHHIFAAGLHDEQFCREWIVGWQSWRDFIRDRGYSPEWAEPITGIPALEIRRLADEIAA